MAAQRKIIPARVYSNEELEQVARDVIRQASGLSGGDFKKLLDANLKKVDKTVVAAAIRLSVRGECYRWVSAKKMRFFTEDPFDALELTVKAALASEPLTEAALKLRVESGHRGFADLVKEWLKGALARGDVFLHPPAKDTKLKRYGNEPNVEDLLKKVLTELRKVVASATGQRVHRARFLDAIASELGLMSSTANPGATGARERFLVELFRFGLDRSPTGLLPVRELRARLTLDKAAFDRIALELSRDELVTLHHHDYPTSLSAAERDELIADDSGQFYVGIALRRAP
jgi:hypothetical protein